MDPRLPTLSGFVLVAILLSWDFGQIFLDSHPLVSKRGLERVFTITYLYFFNGLLLRTESQCGRDMRLRTR